PSWERVLSLNAFSSPRGAPASPVVLLPQRASEALWGSPSGQARSAEARWAHRWRGHSERGVPGGNCGAEKPGGSSAYASGSEEGGRLAARGSRAGCVQARPTRHRQRSPGHSAYASGSEEEPTRVAAARGRASTARGEARSAAQGEAGQQEAAERV